MPASPFCATGYAGPLAAAIRRRLAAHPPRELTTPGLRAAAVLVPIVPDPGGPALLLTRRTEAVAHHKGEICFPGGRLDPGDADSQAAALRETWEEVGIRPEHVRILGLLDDFVSSSGYRVRPFAAVLDRGDYPYRPEPREVDTILVIPIAHLLDPAHHQVEERTGERRHLFHWRGQVVRGLTAAILDQFLRLALTPQGEQ